MRGLRTLARILPVTILLPVLLGAEGCDRMLPEILRELGRRVVNIEERVEAVESCTCCCEGVFEPVCAADGQTYLNPCEARCSATEIVSAGACREGICGGPDGVRCARGQFCELPPGCSDPFAFGRCMERPEGCPLHYDPVCGCDGVSYANDCERRTSGTPLAHPGECPEPPRRCEDPGDCDVREFCATSTGSCSSSGECRMRPEVCPQSLVADPVCGCDGMTYSSACEANRAGASVRHRGACLPLGCFDDEQCGQGRFCEFRTCPSPGIIPIGMCVTPPELCPDIHDPVCGCDGVTYSNDCDRRAAGVSRSHAAACDEPPDPCRESGECPGDSYCAKPSGVCSESGECRPRPVLCPIPLIYCPDPFPSGCVISVCGCDGNEYFSECDAARAGTTVAHQGSCEPIPPVIQLCGGFTSLDCREPDEICLLPSGRCDATDAFGQCVPRPDGCVEIYQPVCGCDGVTYPNECEALRRGAQIAHDGRCEG